MKGKSNKFAMQLGFTVSLVVTIVGLGIIVIGAMVYFQLRPTVLPTSSQTANWETYINARLGVSFKYPPDWQMEEKENFVAVAEDPVRETAIGTCPSYSFSVGQLDPSVDYTQFFPFRNTSFKNRPAEISEKTDVLGCVTFVVFVNRSSVDSTKPKLVVTMRRPTKNPNTPFNQILSTFNFLIP